MGDKIVWMGEWTCHECGKRIVWPDEPHTADDGEDICEACCELHGPCSRESGE